MRISDWSSDVCSSDLVDAARSRQLRAEHGRDEAGRQHAMGDTALEHGLRSVFLVEMQRIGVAGNPGEQNDIRLGQRLGVDGGHADREFIDVIALRRSEEHTSELQSLMRISYAVFCLKKKKKNIDHQSLNDT